MDSKKYCVYDGMFGVLCDTFKKRVFINCIFKASPEANWSNFACMNHASYVIGYSVINHGIEDTIRHWEYRIEK